MPFSVQWEFAYQNGKQNSTWPWAELISLCHRYHNLKKGTRVLELGCGVGANIPFFSSLECDFHAIEGSQAAVERLHKRFPSLRSKIVRADFSKGIPFSESFDIIFDRAALSHNHLADIRAAINNATLLLEPGGVYLGVNWFSTSHYCSKLGSTVLGEPNTRTAHLDGPFWGIGPVHFSGKDEIETLMGNLELVHLEEVICRAFVPNTEKVLAHWNFVARKKDRTR